MFNPLKLTEEIFAKIPIVQGGMAVKVSEAPLAAAVANCGGIGVIAASGLSSAELAEQIRLARRLQENNDGLIAINAMVVADNFFDLVHTAITEGIDLIIFGAGFSKDIFKISIEAKVPVVPIVSSAKLASVSKKLGASAVIVESGEAGGHLGTSRTTRELIPEVKEVIGNDIPIIAAGGITTGQDIVEIMKLGADAVQLGTRFVLSKECTVSEAFKQVLLNAKEEDLRIISSPVGLPGRAIMTPFLERIQQGERILNSCKKCMKHCAMNFCIFEALENARNGDFVNGLVFSGAKVGQFQDILSVKEIFDNLITEANAFSNKILTGEKK